MVVHNLLDDFDQEFGSNSAHAIRGRKHKILLLSDKSSPLGSQKSKRAVFHGKQWNAFLHIYNISLKIRTIAQGWSKERMRFSRFLSHIIST